MLNCNGLYVRLGFQGSGLGQIKLYTPLSKMFSKRAPAPAGPTNVPRRCQQRQTLWLGLSFS